MFNIWLTKKCNLRCKYCYEGIEKSSEMLSKDIIPLLIEFIDKNNVADTLSINFHGGEPLLNTEAASDILKPLKKKYEGMLVSLTTNGTIADPKTLKFIRKNVSELTVSIDGAKLTHDKYRVFPDGSGSFETVMNNVPLLKKNSALMRYRMTFNHETVSELYNNIVFLGENGFDNVVAIPDYFDNGWDDESVAVFRKQLSALKKLSEHTDYYVPFCDPSEYKPRYKCAGGMGTYNIDFDGKLYPCTYTVGDDRYCIGNIINGVDKSRIERLCSDIYDKDVESCNDCKAKQYCASYRCKYINEKLTGDLFTPSVNVCELTRCELENIFC